MTSTAAPPDGDEATLVAFISHPQSGKAAKAFNERFGGFLSLAASDIVDLEERLLVPDIVQTAQESLCDGSRTYRVGGNPRAFLRYAIRDAGKKVRREQPWTIGPPRSKERADKHEPAPVTRSWVEPTPAPKKAVVKGYVPTIAERELASVDSSKKEPLALDIPPLRPKRGRAPDFDATADPALLHIERDRILEAAVADSSPLSAPALVGVAAGAPWTHVGDALGRDPATLRHAIKRVASGLAA